MGLLERLLFSDRGQNLVSLVVARAARETVATVLENLGDQPASPPLAEFLTDRSIGFLSTHAGREVHCAFLFDLHLVYWNFFLRGAKNCETKSPICHFVLNYTLTLSNTGGGPSGLRPRGLRRLRLP